MTTTARSELLPDLPTIGDFVPGYEASGSFGFGAPRNTPAEIVEKLNREINADPCYGAKDSLFFWIGNLLGKALNCLVDWNQKTPRKGRNLQNSLLNSLFLGEFDAETGSIPTASATTHSGGCGNFLWWLRKAPIGGVLYQPLRL